MNSGKLKSIVVLFSLGVTLLWSPQTLWACRCGSVKEESATTWIRKFHGIVFRGKVTNVVILNVPVDQSTRPGAYYREKEVTLAVEELWKGPQRKQFTIRTGIGDGDCGQSFNLDTSYFVAADIDQGKLYTSICTRVLR